MEVPEQVATGIEAASSAEDSSVGTVSHLEWSHIGLRRQFRGLVRVVVQLSNRLDSLESLLALGSAFRAWHLCCPGSVRRAASHFEHVRP